MLCNDDGIHAEGINVLHGLLVKKHEVFVIAPEEEKSGAGSSITCLLYTSPSPRDRG